MASFRDGQLIGFRATRDERQKLERLARETDRSISEVLRCLVKRAAVEPMADVVITSEVQR